MYDLVRYESLSPLMLPSHNIHELVEALFVWKEEGIPSHQIKESPGYSRLPSNSVDSRSCSSAYLIRERRSHMQLAVSARKVRRGEEQGSMLVSMRLHAAPKESAIRVPAPDTINLRLHDKREAQSLQLSHSSGKTRKHCVPP
jgi:hypothetical protein